MPALQPVDKADLDAVRGFLPGKLLGRMAALLALGLLCLARMGAFDLALRNVLGVDLSRDPLLRFGVLGALPAAVVVAQLLAEWRARAQAGRIRARAVAVVEAKERHFRVGPYEVADRAWQALLDAYRLKIRQPFAIRDLTRAMAAQVVGSVVVWFSDPEILRDPLGEQDASLMSRVMVTIFDRLTEPA